MNNPRGIRLKRVDLFFAEQNELAPFVFEAFGELFGLDILVAMRASARLRDGGAAGFVNRTETNVLVFGSGEHFDGNVDKSKADRAFPDRMHE
ncbi:hypothetical protein PAT3040_04425 [Paenibacillus agaridevorans]|uniref:Uncharacterized protein n=1 Tax=Paenibacillus agaridevorans TaxID=171404 RepID=A0A2R5F1W2_9BACL|nr:hypothetical protein PAT3040_04425 [Paenibacillus agaridevorans]